MTRWERRPSAAELGLDVTIAIVAVASPDRQIVAASDQMISYGDFFPATDRGADKILKIANDWLITFAAADVTLFKLILRRIGNDLKPHDDGTLKVETVKKISADAYASVLREEFAARHLIKLGYGSVDDFRRDGLRDLGGSVFGDYLKMLAEFDLGVEIIICGYDAFQPRLFEVVNPGRVVETGVQGYAVVGSGYNMAIASLRQKPLYRGLEDLIYRVLEAKFSAETASGVGKSTRLIAMKQDGTQRILPASDIEKIREVWEKTRQEPIPTAAREVIEASRLVKALLDGES